MQENIKKIRSGRTILLISYILMAAGFASSMITERAASVSGAEISAVGAIASIFAILIGFAVSLIGRLVEMRALRRAAREESRLMIAWILDLARLALLAFVIVALFAMERAPFGGLTDFIGNILEMTIILFSGYGIGRYYRRQSERETVDALENRSEEETDGAKRGNSKPVLVAALVLAAGLVVLTILRRMDGPGEVITAIYPIILVIILHIVYLVYLGGKRKGIKRAEKERCAENVYNSSTE